MSDAITENIRVEVLSQYVPASSKPQESEWVFQYTVRITNQGTESARLVSRHWFITDAEGNVREVQGSGVVGEQPLLAPGQSFQYSSWCPLATPMGLMHGTYQMVSQATGGRTRQFDVQIAPFGLRARYTVN